MPTYVYSCPRCSREVEVVRHYEEAGIFISPECEHCKVTMLRSWNDTPVHFKSKGFYTSDHKKETDR